MSKTLTPSGKKYSSFAEFNAARFTELRAENERLQAEVKRLTFDAESESMRAESATIEALTYATENEELRAALERISGASMSMHASMADLAGFMKRTATEVLRYGSTQESGK